MQELKYFFKRLVTNPFRFGHIERMFIPQGWQVTKPPPQSMACGGEECSGNNNSISISQLKRIATTARIAIFISKMCYHFYAHSHRVCNTTISRVSFRILVKGGKMTYIRILGRQLLACEACPLPPHQEIFEKWMLWDQILRHFRIKLLDAHLQWLWL